MEQRIMPCSECGGDGGWEQPTGSYNHYDGTLDTVWCKCRACGGSGEEEVEVSPVTFDDLSHDLTMEEALRLDEEKLIALGAYDPQPAFPWHGGCGAIECVNGCDGAPDYCAAALSWEGMITSESPQERAAGEAGTSTGWVFWNPDTGEEYSPNHPVDSGEVPDAQNIRPATECEQSMWRDIQRSYQLGLLVADFIETPSLHSKTTKEFGRVYRDDLPQLLRRGVSKVESR